MFKVTWSNPRAPLNGVTIASSKKGALPVRATLSHELGEEVSVWINRANPASHLEGRRALFGVGDGGVYACTCHVSGGEAEMIPLPAGEWAVSFAAGNEKAGPLVFSSDGSTVSAAKAKKPPQ